METLTINSRKIKTTFNFYLYKSGYIYVSTGETKFQPTDKNGNTLMADKNDFEKVCRKWVKNVLQDRG